MGLSIRIIETYLFSLIPSAVCTWVITFLDNQLLWQASLVVAFIVFLAANVLAWRDHLICMENDILIFYIANLISLAAFFAGLVYCMWVEIRTDVLSTIYASFRCFERISENEIPTLASALIAMGITIIAMIATQQYVSWRIRREEEMELAELEEL